MVRLENESYLSYAKRLTNALDNKTIDFNKYGDLLFGVDNAWCSDNIRKFTYCFRTFIEKYDKDTLKDNYDSLKELEDLRYEIIKERKKLQTVNLEYNHNARVEARLELCFEGIKEAIGKLEPIEIKNVKYTKHDCENTGVLAIADAHYGRDVIQYGLFGEVINQYNTKEFENRMWDLLGQLEAAMINNPVDKLDIIDCGDNIEGILRLCESLKTLKSGVVDSSIKYAEFMANWLVECHNRLEIPVTYSLTSGNHDVLRLLTSKPSFEEETVGKFIYNHIMLRIENAKLKAQIDGKECHIDIEPFNDVVYHNYYGMNVLSYHGDSKNLKEDIEFFENYYQIDIDILISGHLHRGSSETIGIGYMGDREVIRVPSICGSDTFSKKIRRLARAGCQYMIFNESGLDWQKKYYLN